MLQVQKASAGSGKTFTLTREYIKMLLGSRREDGSYRLRSASSFGARKAKRHGNILAVTFTNKATEEMTSRIVKDLSVLAGREPGGKSPYMSDFVSDFGVTEREIALSADAALKDLLYNFAQFNVMTIDSFFQNVLRTFARELELPDNPNLEIDEEFPVATAVNEMLSSLKSGPRDSGSETPEERTARLFLENWLRQFMNAQLEEGAAMNIFSRNSKLTRSVISSVKGLMGETYKLNRRSIDGYLSDPSRIVEFQKYVSEKYNSLRSGAVEKSKALLAVIGDAANLSRNVRTTFTEVARGKFPKSPTASTVASREEEAKRYDATFRKKGGVTPLIDSAYTEAVNAVLTFYERGMAYRMISNRIYILGIFGTVLRFLEEYRHETDTFLLSDTNDLLRRIISEDEAPFIYERLGNSILHYLIDEFQDTSKMQWENFRPLLLESLSRENDNLIIGDEKQSIYRFRNSDPDLLRSGVEEEIHGRFGEGAVTLRGVTIEENCNWRSSREIVMFNNALFHEIAELADRRGRPGDVTGIYANLVQKIPDSHLDFHGYVKAVFEGDATGGDSAAGVRQLKEERMLDRLVREISRQLSAGYAPGDIAVLVRKRVLGERVITRLMEAMDEEWWPHGHVPILSADALRVESCHGVQMIINFLRLATTPELVLDVEKSEQTGAKVMKSNPEFRRFRLIHRYELSLIDTVVAVDPETGEAVRDESGRPVMRNLTPQEALRKAIAATSLLPGDPNLDEVQKSIDRQTEKIRSMGCPTLLGITESIISDFLSDDAKRIDNTFLTAFQDLVADFSEHGESDIRSFLEWWDYKGHNSTLSAPEGLQAITVTTIHQSKGLEYPCVHVPFCNDRWEMVSMKGQGWLPLDKGCFPDCPEEILPPMMPLDYGKVASLKDNPVFGGAIFDYARTQRVDNLNTAYVAFTRAVNELVVYSEVFKPRKDGSESETESFGRYLFKVLSVGGDSAPCDEGKKMWMAELSPALWREEPDGSSVFELGMPLTRERSVETVCEALSEGVCPRCYRVVDHPDAHLAVALDVDKLAGFDMDDDRCVGTFLHRVLSGVRHVADLPLSLRRNAYRFGLSDAQAASMLAFLSEALSQPEVSKWFSGFRRLLNERPLTAPASIRRPDRVVWLPDGEIHVVDYKFGLHDSPAYYEQVRDYIGLIEGAFPSAKVRGFLWFPTRGRIIEVN